MREGDEMPTPSKEALEAAAGIAGFHAGDDKNKCPVCLGAARALDAFAAQAAERMREACVERLRSYQADLELTEDWPNQAVHEINVLGSAIDMLRDMPLLPPAPEPQEPANG